MTDNKVKKIIAGLEVYCKYHDYDCTWSGAMGENGKDYITYITSCPIRGKICPQGCGVVVEWTDEKEHISSGYNDGCPKSFLRKDLDGHLSTCNYRLVNCEFKHFDLASLKALSGDLPWIMPKAYKSKIQYRHYEYAMEHARIANAGYRKLEARLRAYKKDGKLEEDEKLEKKLKSRQSIDGR